ncbi:MAG: hypothetical protein ACLGI2_04990 [Acidimicrobiia bacterium]
MTRRAGPVLALLYAAVAAATAALAPHVGRPLFDGFAPPPPYNYVEPPPELRSSNFPPRAATTSVVLEEGGTAAINVSTEDAQAIVTLPAGAVPPNPDGDDQSVTVGLLPLAPSALPPLPPELRPASNVYQLALTYQPSGTPVGAGGLAAGATVALTGGLLGDTLLYSADGQAWQRVPARPFGNTHGMTGPVQGPGYYLVAASPAVPPPTITTEDGAGGGGMQAIGVALVAGGLVGAAFYVRNRRQERRRR